METKAELRRLALVATTGPWPWIRPWGAVTVHAIGNDDVLADQRNLDLAVAAVNALPALLDENQRLRAALIVVLDALKDQNDASGLIWNMLEARDQARAALEAA